jgi:hypothetical protein
MTAIAVFLQFAALDKISGVQFYMPTYFFYVLLSIPIFLLVRRFYGWTFISCSVSALLVVAVPEILTGSWPDHAPVSAYQLWLLSAVASLVYGCVFWFLAPRKFRKKVAS